MTNVEIILFGQKCAWENCAKPCFEYSRTQRSIEHILNNLRSEFGGHEMHVFDDRSPLGMIEREFQILLLKSQLKSHACNNG